MDLIFVGLLGGFLGGFLSGLLGIGGGVIIVPFLLYYGIDIKTAILLSVTHMFFVSILKTSINLKNNEFYFKDIKFIIFGALLGGLSSNILLKFITDEFIFYLFIIVVVLSYINTLIVFQYKYNIFKIKKSISKTKTVLKLKYTFIVSYLVSTFSLTAGIGGSILFNPILIKYFGKTTKETINLSLVYLMSSTSLFFLILYLDNQILNEKTFYMLSGSLIGVLIGSKIMKIANTKFLDISLFSILNIIIIYIISK